MMNFDQGDSTPRDEESLQLSPIAGKRISGLSRTISLVVLFLGALGIGVLVLSNDSTAWPRPGLKTNIRRLEGVAVTYPTISLSPVTANWILIGQLLLADAQVLCRGQTKDANGSPVVYFQDVDKKVQTVAISSVTDCTFSNGLIAHGQMGSFKYAVVCGSTTDKYCQVFDTSPETNLYPVPKAALVLENYPATSVTHGHGVLTSKNYDLMMEPGIGDIVTPDVSSACCSGSLTYYGGRLLTNVAITPIYWNSNCRSQAFFNTFYTDIVTTSFLGFLGEFTTNGYNIALAGSRGTPYVDNQGITNTITNAVITARLSALITAGSVPAPANNRLYSIHFPPNAVINPGVPGISGLSCSAWCGYHFSYMRNGQKVYYQVIVDNTTPNCQCGGGYGDGGMTSVISHEVVEAITDPDVNAGTLGWYDSTDNGEIGDLCSWQTVVATYHGHSYRVQKEWSNYNNKCIAPGPTAAPAPAPSSSCFSADSTLEVLPQGSDVAVTKTIDTIQIGDRVLSSNGLGVLTYSDVVVLPHLPNETPAEFVKLETSTGRTLKLTPDHFLVAGSCEILTSSSSAAAMPVIRAAAVTPGMCVKTVGGVETVAFLETIADKGIYTVIPMEEFVVVNGIIASPYAAPHKLSHYVFNIYRVLYKAVPSWMKSKSFLKINEGLLAVLGENFFPILNGKKGFDSAAVDGNQASLMEWSVAVTKQRFFARDL